MDKVSVSNKGKRRNDPEADRLLRPSVYPFKCGVRERSNDRGGHEAKHAPVMFMSLRQTETDLMYSRLVRLVVAIAGRTWTSLIYDWPTVIRRLSLVV